jgi:hypothetical protein
LQSDTVPRSEIDYRPANVGRITNRQDVIDPFANRPAPIAPPKAANLTRTDTIRSGFHRAGNTLRKSGRRVKQKASTARQSLRRAAAKPIVPQSAIDRARSHQIQRDRRLNQATGVNNNAYYDGGSTVVVEVTPELPPRQLQHNWNTLLRETAPKTGSCQGTSQTYSLIHIL